MMNDRDEVELGVKAKCGVVLQRERKLAKMLMSKILVVTRVLLITAKDSRGELRKKKDGAGLCCRGCSGLIILSSLDR